VHLLMYFIGIFLLNELSLLFFPVSYFMNVWSNIVLKFLWCVVDLERINWRSMIVCIEIC
jgi:hypothetical protein